MAAFLLPSRYLTSFKGGNAFLQLIALKTINVPAKKADYYKKRLPENLHSLIVELPAEKKK